MSNTSSHRFSVVMPAELVAKLDALAERHARSRNWLVRRAVERLVDAPRREESRPTPAPPSGYELSNVRQVAGGRWVAELVDADGQVAETITAQFRRDLVAEAERRGFA